MDDLTIRELSARCLCPCAYARSFELLNKVAAERAMGDFELRLDQTVPEGQIEFRDGNRLVGVITGIAPPLVGGMT